MNLAYSLDDCAIAIFSDRLEWRGTICGIVSYVWPNGFVEYQSHERHFGPHHVGVNVFDPRRRANREIYPPNACRNPLFPDADDQTLTEHAAAEPHRVPPSRPASRAQRRPIRK